MLFSVLAANHQPAGDPVAPVLELRLVSDVDAVNELQNRGIADLALGKLFDARPALERHHREAVAEIHLRQGALAASEAGIEPVLVERERVPSGSTALSAGLIPAAGTRFQAAQGISDSADLFADDIARKAHGEADPQPVRAVAERAGPLVEWLSDTYALPFEVITDFNYPGHSAHRMHGLPSRTGAELIDRLRGAAESRGIPILTGRAADALFADEGGCIAGLAVNAGSARETIGCCALVLACSGYGGNPALVRRHIPDMADALYFGHPGNRGDAVLWGEALGARLMHLAAYQGHGSVATPHNILITWAAIMEGGFQVNAEGRRFSDEALGYSEQAADVLRQPGARAFCIFDARIAGVARQFEDFRNAEKAGAVIAGEFDRGACGAHRGAGGRAARGAGEDRWRPRCPRPFRPRSSRWGRR